MSFGPQLSDEKTMPQSPGLTERILVVEDDPAVQKALKRMFEDEGFAVETHSNGRAGLDSFYANAPSATILDLRLPKLAGQHLCQEMKAAAPSIPVIVLSAFSDVHHKVLLLDMGADDYVTKPFSPRELLWLTFRSEPRFSVIEEYADSTFLAPSAYSFHPRYFSGAMSKKTSSASLV